MPLGREAVLSCVINDLGEYKVHFAMVTTVIIIIELIIARYVRVVGDE